MNLLIDIDVVNLLLKNNGVGDRGPNFVILCSTECFECRRLGGDGLGERVLFRAG